LRAAHSLTVTGVTRSDADRTLTAATYPHYTCLWVLLQTCATGPMLQQLAAHRAGSRCGSAWGLDDLEQQ